MTVNQLIKHLNSISESGLGDIPIKLEIFNPPGEMFSTTDFYISTDYNMLPQFVRLQGDTES